VTGTLFFVPSATFLENVATRGSGSTGRLIPLPDERKIDDASRPQSRRQMVRSVSVH